MTRLLLLLLILAPCFGCAAGPEKGAWGEVLKDMRGDNMRMRGFGAEAPSAGS